MSLNFMHMKMCSSFFSSFHCCDGKFIIVRRNSSSISTADSLTFQLLWFFFAFWSLKDNFFEHVVGLIILLGFPIVKFFLDFKPRKIKNTQKENSRELFLRSRAKNRSAKGFLSCQKSSFDLQKNCRRRSRNAISEIVASIEVRLADEKSWLRRARFSAPRQRENKFSGN